MNSNYSNIIQLKRNKYNFLLKIDIYHKYILTSERYFLMSEKAKKACEFSKNLKYSFNLFTR